MERIKNKNGCFLAAVMSMVLCVLLGVLPAQGQTAVTDAGADIPGTGADDFGTLFDGQDESGAFVPGFGPVADGEEKPRDIFLLALPAEWGRVREIFKGEPGRVVVHIQEAHTHYECQQNIMSILDRLVEHYGLRIVGIEGASARVATELFATYPDDEARDRLVDYLLRVGRMAGPEALVIKRGMEYPLELYGIEDAELYANNLKSFQAAFPFKEETLRKFSILRSALTELKIYLFSQNEALLAFDTRQDEFRENEISLKEYTAELAEQLGRFGLAADEYVQFSRYLGAIALEDTIDFSAAEQERAMLLGEITGELTDEEMQQLLEQGRAYQSQELAAAAYLRFLWELAQQKNLNPEDYRNLRGYIDYAQAFDELDSSKLFQEIDDIGFAIKERMHATPPQRQVDFLAHGLDVMQRLIEIKMVNRDLKFYREHAAELKAGAFYRFIAEQGTSYGIRIALPETEVDYIDVYIPAWAEFYRVAGLRDEAMVNNTRKLFDEHNQEIIAMVTGGFHTAELTRLMRERNISYVVITPRVTADITTPYFERLTGSVSELERFLETVTGGTIGMQDQPRR